MKKFLLLVAAAVTLAACTNEDNIIDIDNEEPVKAHISASIQNSSITRVADQSWASGDKIGVTMVGRYNNLAYTYTEAENGKFEGADMYFRNKRDAETLTAYYPHSGTEGTPPEIIEANTSGDFQTPAEQTKYDFLFAKKENVSGSAPNVTLDFSHKMSKITFTFKKGNDGTDVSKITSCRITGLVLQGTFNPVTGDCAATTGIPTSPLDLSLSVQEGVALPPLILFPQNVEKVTLKITDSEEQEYSCELKFADDRLESGNNYVYTIVVKKTALNVEQFTIANWTE
ncbi:MAG: fimbrillin family protein, partial [Muribaculaceae bacterium]|nr:fimbrillin family protein [Muribaculaceae bacterium]